MIVNRFWNAGTWEEIIVDDRLPTRGGELVFLCAPKSEFWAPLLEKAYAKFYGSYGAIEGGQISEAMVDFTGGIVERYNLKRAPNNLFKIIKKSYEKGSLMGASIFRDTLQTDYKRSKGLFDGHAYAVTKIMEVDVENENPGKSVQQIIIRIKNPWSDHNEWNGKTT